MSDRPKIYLETSVISYLVARPSPDPEKTGMWRYAMRFMDEYAQGYDIVVSDIVAKEAGRGNPDEAARRLEKVREFRMLQYDAALARSLSAQLRERHQLFEKAVEDSMHIAACAVAGVDFLLTWNCRHMANPIALQKTIRIVTECGYECPVIVTPRELVTELAGEYYDDPIVREVHEARYAIMAEFGGNVDAFFDYLAAHPVSGARYVSPKPFKYESVAGD